MTPFPNLQRYLATYQNQRPFWESDDEIDVGIISDILVVIYRYIQEDESIPMFQMCLEQTRSCAVKMCAVRALTLLSIEVVSIDSEVSTSSLHTPETSNTLAAFAGQGPRCFITSDPLCSYCKLQAPLRDHHHM